MECRRNQLPSQPRRSQLPSQPRRNQLPRKCRKSQPVKKKKNKKELRRRVKKSRMKRLMILKSMLMTLLCTRFQLPMLRQEMSELMLGPAAAIAAASLLRITSLAW